MLEHPIIAFDIETIPDPDIGRRLMGLSGDDATVITEMVRLRLEETDGKQEYPQLPWQRVVCVCATLVDVQTGRFGVKTLGGELLDERSHIEGFFRLLTKRPPRLVSWNGAGFDLPVLRYRSMMLGIAAPELYSTEDERKWNNYQNRYHDMHTDLMDVLSGYGSSPRVGLGMIARTLDLPGKTFLEHAVYRHVLAGEYERVVEYCKLDTVQTMLAYLVWAYHCGRLPEAQLRALAASMRETIMTFEYPAWREVDAALLDWPKWSR